MIYIYLDPMLPHVYIDPHMYISTDDLLGVRGMIFMDLARSILARMYIRMAHLIDLLTDCACVVNYSWIAPELTKRPKQGAEEKLAPRPLLSPWP